MITPWIKTALAATALSGMAATGYAFQDQFDGAKARLAGTSGDASANASLSAAITEWRSLSQTKTAPFDSYARFMLAHPGWPGEATMRWREDATVGAGGEYVMTSEGARVADFRYIRNKDGKIFRFEEDLQASGENACTWNK